LIAYTQQLRLPFAHDEHTLKDHLQQLTGRDLNLIITDNATSMLSVRKKAESITVRLHKMFLHAGTEVCLEVADFIKKGRSDRQSIRSFISQNRHLLKQKSPVKLTPRVAGENYCLKKIFDSLNSEYFDGTISSSITWGKSNSKKRVRMRTMGSYNAETSTIRINPLLDKKTVPEYFLEFVVYHEMLHAYLGIKTRNGRRSIHSGEFRFHEKKFRHYAKAREWERQRFGLRR
jgi:predicted SprT family Zn-dependent metalloprotease